MPFPWKKNRVSRISQIVADLQSPKHGGSLVVETGFPTSLIDLFVKNKGRFRKPKNKKRHQVEISDSLRETPAEVLPPTPPPETSNLSDRTVCAEGIVLRRRVEEDVDCDDGVEVSGQDCVPVRESDGGSDSNMIFAAVFKMLIVLVLTLSMKKLTVGITMSAFVLFFLEFIGKRVLCCLKPCPIANKTFNSLAQRVSNSIWVQNLVMAFKQSKGSDSEGSASPVFHEEHLVLGLQSSYSPTCIEEIEILQTESENEKGIPIPCEEIHSAELASITEEQSKSTILEMECDECKGNEKDKRISTLKSKIVQKLVPKKYRRSKGEKESKGREEESSLPSREISSMTEESEKSRRSEIEEKPSDIDKEEHDSGNRSKLLLPRKLDCIQDNEADNAIARSNESSLLKEEDNEAVSDAEKRADRIGNSGHIILFLFALVGLVVGRFSALLLMLAWLFMLKMIKNGGLSVNLPLVRCSIPISGKNIG